MSNPSVPQTLSELQNLMREYPYLVPPLVESLSRPDLPEEMRQQILSRITLNIGDEQYLRTALGIDPSEFNSFYADMSSPELSTTDTIDSFLNHFASTPVDDDLHYAPAIDYAAMLEQNQETAQISLSENIEGKKSEQELPDVVSIDTPHQQSLSESLAAVMIKNHNYTKALEIIVELSLKNPEKSVYFADQIRFLRKLIYAQNRKKSRN